MQYLEYFLSLLLLAVVVFVCYIVLNLYFEILNYLHLNDHTLNHKNQIILQQNKDQFVVFQEILIFQNYHLLIVLFDFVCFFLTLYQMVQS